MEEFILKNKILIIDDEREIVSFMRDALLDEGYDVLTAYNAEQALKQINVAPDLIILDVMMPEVDGFELCPKLRERINCPIIFLSARQSETDRIKGLAVGGDDYLIKPFSIRELKARVHAHLRREKRQSHKQETILRFGKLEIDLSGHQVNVEDKEISLTRREFEILEFLALHPGQVFSREQIYEKVWGYDATGDDTTITEHIKKIRSKIYAADPDTEYISTVWGIGYKWKCNR
ncbi:response regulator transcription factor [Thermoactinomyces intermedius]|jgi:two-component system, OmpR family, lantibiotic biosynthesis response regulator NisR/SpaR|uniref:Response regulator transcription factor n=1 Tax=Thermoactinomyces intermedius TaxID=2024 RepID=A0A8I1AEN5_THEIN|nr:MULTISPECIES: response regulator transcription factor [Thermoactinomyces]MBA4550097.1 response regulator transcription factor [Thermoactinomyces intermedius]MBA4837733.1 response regulator transcription factor [Thermoactinomyces intermedius]MBH8596422.1 response regulator transcription factor [Thermoactinomyces intermedius]MBH8602535.1 response regulator transcription factor [Thermoactinomyces sp. CICC 23799]